MARWVYRRPSFRAFINKLRRGVRPILGKDTGVGPAPAVLQGSFIRRLLDRATVSADVSSSTTVSVSMSSSETVSVKLRSSDAR